MPEMMAIKIDGVVKNVLCYNTEEAAKALGVCTARVLQMRREGKLVAYSHGEKGCKSKFFFNVEDIEDYNLHRNDPKPPEPMKPLAPVSAAKKPRKRAQKR